MPKRAPRAYHHGGLRQAVIEAAVDEVEAVGAANLSMREIARRAGVSHAAPAHHFGDKAGIFTAIAIEGFRLATEATREAAGGPNGLIDGGLAYVLFAIGHRGHYEVMFRPELYDADDPELVAARDAAFQVLHDAARAAVGDDTTDVSGLVVASWSLAHGFATLWLQGNLEDQFGTDVAGIAAHVSSGIIALGEITRRQVAP
jgi:AcrR family transcriptional regulator